MVRVQSGSIVRQSDDVPEDRSVGYRFSGLEAWDKRGRKDRVREAVAPLTRNCGPDQAASGKNSSMIL